MNEYLGAAEMIGRQAPDVARALLAGAKFVPPPDETTKT